MDDLKAGTAASRAKSPKEARPRVSYPAPRPGSGVRHRAKRVSEMLRNRCPTWAEIRMREAGLVGVSRRRGVRTTRRAPGDQSAPDLVQRAFTATAPNQLRVADITYVPTWAGFLYLAIVLDAYSRRIVGWAMGLHLRTELVLDALNMAVTQRRPSGVIHHADHGCQSTALAFGQRCRAMGVRPSMGTVGECYDNAMAESFFATLECELLDRQSFHSPTEARPAIFQFIEGWYNPHRRHSALGQKSPIDYERLSAAAA